MQNPQPVTLVYTTTTTPNVRPGFGSQTAKALGIAQIIFGVLLIVLQVASIVYLAGFMFVGHGIWTGIIIIIAGSFGIASSKHSTTCLIVTFMVMSIIAATFSTVPLSLSAAALPWDLNGYGLFENYENQDTRAALDCTMLVVSFLEIVVAIWSSVICCKVLCCAPPVASAVAPGRLQVQYVTAQPGGQQVQPVNVVIAGPSGPAGQPQQTFMYGAPESQPYMVVPGQTGGYVQPMSSSGQATGGDSSPPPAYGAGEVGLMTQGTFPPMEKKSAPLP